MSSSVLRSDLATFGGEGGFLIGIIHLGRVHGMSKRFASSVLPHIESIEQRELPLLAQVYLNSTADKVLRRRFFNDLSSSTSYEQSLGTQHVGIYAKFDTSS